MRTATQVRFINLEKNLMGFFKDLITFGGYSQSKATAKAAQDQARQQEELYNQQLKEQQEAAILKGDEMAESVATINTGGGGSYADDPFAKRKKRFNFGSSDSLGIM